MLLYLRETFEVSRFMICLNLCNYPYLVSYVIYCISICMILIYIYICIEPDLLISVFTTASRLLRLGSHESDQMGPIKSLICLRMRIRPRSLNAAQTCWYRKQARKYPIRASSLACLLLNRSCLSRYIISKDSFSAKVIVHQLSTF